MKVYCTKPDLPLYVLERPKASVADAQKLFRNTNWEVFSFFRLRKNDQEWLEISGSLSDGMGVDYSDGSTLWISYENFTLDEFADIIEVFMLGDIQSLEKAGWEIHLKLTEKYLQNELTREYLTEQEARSAQSANTKRKWGCLFVLICCSILAYAIFQIFISAQ